MEPKPILCVGALTCDLVLQVPSLPHAPGKFLASRSAMVAAGMAASAATAVARLGHPVALWASAGDDMIGDFVVSEMAKEDIDTSFIRRLRGIMSASASIIVDAQGERMVVPFYDAALLSVPEATPPVADYAAVLVDVRWPAAAADALDLARYAGIPAILDLDVGPVEALADLASRANHLVASLAGARILTGADTAAQAVAELAARYPIFIAVTDGERGVSWREPGTMEMHLTPAFPVEAVDTNAAGDIFHGAYAVAVAEGKPSARALRFASAAAAIKCTRYGSRAGAPTRQEVDHFLHLHAA